MTTIKHLQIEERDFSQLNQFPGEKGNTFDRVLAFFDTVNRIRGPYLLILLFILACLPTLANWPLAFGLWGFFVGDYLLISGLRVFSISFGPAKPTVLCLALMRAVIALIPFPLPVAVGLQTLGTLLVFYAFWLEPQWLRVTHQTLSVPGFSPARPLRLVHFGDLHLERFTRREEKLLEQIQKLKPDIVLFSGDILNISYRRYQDSWQDARRVFEQIRAPLGVYIVSGSPGVDIPKTVQTITDGLPLRWLQDELLTLDFEGQPFSLIGLSCTHRPHQDKQRLLDLLKGQPLSPFNILLHHSPDLAPAAAKLGIRLQLSGHTHGGQICLPFFGALFTASLYGRVFASGRYALDQLTLYITRGLGLEGMGAPRVRFLCPPEVTLWEIQ